jgi:uncharacterized protein
MQAFGFKGTDPYISTVKGRQFYISKPVFDAEEMGHAMGNACRYGGHSRRFYSVAEHSLLVAMLCEQLGLADPFEGLMHDAHEAYFVDMPKPWKMLIPQYVEIEQYLEGKLREQYKLVPKISDGCKQADLIALAMEARQLLPNKGTDFEWPPGILAQAHRLRDFQLNYWEPNIARSHWLAAFAEFAGPRGIVS